jgi:hypothetical protein
LQTHSLSHHHHRHRPRVVQESVHLSSYSSSSSTNSVRKNASTIPTHSHATRVGENGVDVRVVPDAVTYRGGGVVVVIFVVVGGVEI